MKKKVAKKRLKRKCDQCGSGFFKGSVYYVERFVFASDNKIISAFEDTYCAKCNYENKRHKERYERFKNSGTCEHPIIDEVWSPIPGETHLLQPDHYECLVCGEWL